MTNQVMDLFGQMTVVEIETFVKDMVKPYLKERKSTELQSMIDSVKGNLHEGDLVTVRYKDTEITGTVVAIRDKSFSILSDEILNAKGEPSRISRGYNFVVSVEETDETSEEVAV